MLKPVRMTKVRAICLKKIAPSIIKALHEMSVLHLKDFTSPQVERSGPLSSYDVISTRLISIRAMKDLLGKQGKLPKKPLEMKSPLKEADLLLGNSAKLSEMIREKEEAEKELDSTISSQKAIEGLVELKINFSQLNLASLQFLLLKADEKNAKLASIELSSKKNLSFTSASAGKGSEVLIIALEKSGSTKFLEKFGQILPIPKLSSTPRHEMALLREKEQAISDRILVLKRRLQRFSDLNYPKLCAVEEALSIEADRAKAATMFGTTESVYYIDGWVEKRKFSHLKKELKKRFGKRLHVYEEAASKGEIPPTKLSNPKKARSFEYIVGFLSPPQYNEIDPTLIIAFAIPIIYALILGDAGYAVMSFLMASWLIKKSQPGSLLRNVSLIWAISAIPTFFAGILFNEYFGFTHGHLLETIGIIGVHLYDGLGRVASVQTLILLTLIVGMFHVGLGLAIGVINGWKHHRKHAIAKLSWLGIEISGFFLVAAYMFSSFPFLGMPSLVLFIASTIALIKTEGIIGVFEIPSLAGNIMSYIRIAAVGIGGLILAEIINELLLPSFELSLTGIILFAISAVLYIAFHAIVCFIAMFESLIHGARLNVVEFFGKFYQGNGIQFLPFSAKRVFTQKS